MAMRGSPGACAYLNQFPSQESPDASDQEPRNAFAGRLAHRHRIDTAAQSYLFCPHPRGSIT
jgi:hypothetical protein